jgi:glucose-6-phosphate isomerase
MTAVIRSLTASPAWKSLETHHEKVRELHLRKLFSDDPKRGERMTVEAMGIYLDYSKNRITNETLELLIRLADECGLRTRIDSLLTCSS